MEDLGIDKIVSGIKIDGSNPFVQADEESWNDVPLWIPTGCVSLDYAIGGFKRGFRGGIPLGKVAEINGIESSGKSALTQHIIRETLKLGGAVFLCDSEHSTEVERLHLIGANTTNFRFLELPKGIQIEEIDDEPEGQEDADEETKISGKKKKKVIARDLTLEEFYGVAEDTLAKFRKKIPNPKVPILIALDSLAAIETQAQQDARKMNMKDKIDTSVVMANLLKGFCSKLTQYNAAMVFVNQLRTKIGAYGDPLYSYGGDTKNYHFSIRVRMVEKGTQIKFNDDIQPPDGEYLEGDVTGMQFRGQIVKNKMAEPWRKFRMPFFFDRRGFWHEQCLAQLIIDREKWKFSEKLDRKAKKGSGEGNTFYWDGEELGVGERGLTTAFVDDPLLCEEIERELFMETG